MKKLSFQKINLEPIRNALQSVSIPPLLLLLIWMAVVYTVHYFWNPVSITLEFVVYLIKPLFWLALGGLVYWFYRRGELPDIRPQDKIYFSLAVIFGLIHVSILFIFGLIFKFGHSPYSRTWYLLLLNLWFIGVQIFSLELFRWAILKLIAKKLPNFSIILTWIICAAVLILPGNYQLLTDIEGVFDFFGNTFLMIFARGLLATYLALIGGPLVSATYIGITTGYVWLLPILPNPPLMVNAFLETIIPALGLIIIHQYFLNPQRQENYLSYWQENAVGEVSKDDKFSMGSWITILIFAVFLIFLNTGIFGIKPMLISGFSMEPTFVVGDLVVTRTVTAEDIEVGDIVWFSVDGIDILHRIIEIDEANSKTPYITQGDNNNVQDAPISFDQINGEVILVIPKLGWVAIWVRQTIAWLGAVVS